MIWKRLPKILVSCGLLVGLFSTVAAQDLYTRDEIEQSRKRYERAEKLYRKKRCAQAITELDNALKVREIYPEAQWLLAQALVKAERPREAFEMLRSVGAPYRLTSEFWKLSGQVFLQMNKTAEAEKALVKALSLSSRSDPELHYFLGLLRLRQGESADAVYEAELALKIQPRFLPARRLLSDAALVRCDYRRAERELALYLRGARNEPEAANLRQRLLVIRTLSQARDSYSSVSAPRIRYIPKPKYTAEARRNRIEGTVRLEVLFGSEGQVEQVIVTQGLGFGLDAEATRAARGIEFTPGRLADRPTSVWAGVVYRFSNLEVETVLQATP
jgi:TonB family protein